MAVNGCPQSFLARAQRRGGPDPYPPGDLRTRALVAIDEMRVLISVRHQRNVSSPPDSRYLQEGTVTTRLAGLGLRIRSSSRHLARLLVVALSAVTIAAVPA